MYIHDIHSQIVDDEKVISGMLDDEKLWYKLPKEFGQDQLADPFVAAALLVAMKAGESIKVDPKKPVSYKLLWGISLLQDLYSNWWPEFQPIEVECEVGKAAPVQDGIASFFSGGVDSLYTFYRRQQLVTHLVFLGGVDVQLDNEALYTEALKSNRTFAKQQEKTLIPVVTNLRDICHSKGISWGSQFSGAGLSSVALLLGFPYALVPASQAHEEHYPDATSPALDHLFSNEATTIYYDGAVKRYVKIKELGEIPSSLDRLRVCWQDNGYNCGKCEKCVRTMLLLKFFNLECPTLPEFEGWQSMRKWRIESDVQKRIISSLIKVARETNNRRIRYQLIYLRRREAFKRWLASIDRVYFSGSFKRMFKKVIGPA